MLWLYNLRKGGMDHFIENSIFVISREERREGFLLYRKLFKILSFRKFFFWKTIFFRWLQLTFTIFCLIFFSYSYFRNFLFKKVTRFSWDLFLKGEKGRFVFQVAVLNFLIFIKHFFKLSFFLIFSFPKFFF